MYECCTELIDSQHPAYNEIARNKDGDMLYMNQSYRENCCKEQEAEQEETEMDQQTFCQPCHSACAQGLHLAYRS